jgi:hypothetical protein
MNKSILIERVNKCISIAEELKQARYVHKDEVKKEILYGKWLSQITSYLIDIFGDDHPYTKNFKKPVALLVFPVLIRELVY